MGYKELAIRGMGWMAALRGTTRAIAFIKIAVLARLLGPDELGIYGISAIVLGFLEIVTDTGVNTFLIQENEDIKKYINSAWIVSILRGVAITLIIIAAAVPISQFFNAPNALHVIFLSSLIPFARGFINPAVITYQKNLKFNKEFYFRTVVFFIDALATLMFALILRSANAIIIGMLTGVLVEILFSFLFISPRPRFAIEKKTFRLITSRAKWLTTANIFNYLFQELDDTVVGKVLGTTSLGLYQTAYKISTLPITEGGEIIIRVAYPIFVKIREDTYRLRRAFFSALGVILFIFVPFSFLLYFYTEPIITIILGESWLSASGALRILAFFGFSRILTGFAGSLFLSVKKQQYVTLVSFVGLFGMILFLVPFVRLYGIEGAAKSALFGTLATIPFIVYFSYSILFLGRYEKEKNNMGIS